MSKTKAELLEENMELKKKVKELRGLIRKYPLMNQEATTAPPRPVYSREM